MMELKIRDHKPDDVNAQAKLVNNVLSEMDPDFPPYTPEKIQQEYDDYDPKFVPEQVKYLIKPDGEIVGYVECTISSENYYLDYPLIIKEFRSEKTINMLFKAIYDFVKKNNPKEIQAVYPTNFLDEAHEYFRKQTITNIKEIQEVKQISIPVEKLDYDIPGYELKPFTIDDVETLVNYRHSKESIAGMDVTTDRLKESIESGDFTPENSALIYKGEDLLGFCSINIREPPYDPFSMNRNLQSSYGSINGLAVDIAHSDMQRLRKAYLKVGHSYLKKKGIDAFITAFSVTDERKTSHFQELGFDLTGEGEFIYIFD